MQHEYSFLLPKRRLRALPEIHKTSTSMQKITHYEDNTQKLLMRFVGVMSTARVSLAEVFHPWVRWEGPGSGFENSSGAAGASGAGGGGVWKSRIHRFGPRVIEVEKQGFRTAWLISGQKFP